MGRDSKKVGQDTAHLLERRWQGDVKTRRDASLCADVLPGELVHALQYLLHLHNLLQCNIASFLRVAANILTMLQSSKNTQQGVA